MLTKAGRTFAPDGPCLLGKCGLANQVSSCLKTNFKSWLYFSPEKNVDSEILISSNFNVMTLNITWLLDCSQSSDAVEATSCTLSPNPIASSIPSPATLPWGQTARERWDHIHTRQPESRTAPLKGCFCGQVRASPGNLPEMHIVWSSLDLLTQKLEMEASHPSHLWHILPVS